MPDCLDEAAAIEAIADFSGIRPKKRLIRQGTGDTRGRFAIAHFTNSAVASDLRAHGMRWPDGTIADVRYMGGHMSTHSRVTVYKRTK